MLNVKKLNEKIAEIGVNKISWIVQEDWEGNWEILVVPDRADNFGFDFDTGKFANDTARWWNDFRIKKSSEGGYNVILSGFGTAYSNN